MHGPIFQLFFRLLFQVKSMSIYVNPYLEKLMDTDLHGFVVAAVSDIFVGITGFTKLPFDR